MILDETTSAIDPDNAFKVIEGINNFLLDEKDL